MKTSEALSTFSSVLRSESVLQREGKLQDMGKRYDELDSLQGSSDPDRRLTLAWRFFDSWIDEKDHGFAGMHRGMRREDWPDFANQIADYLDGRSALDPKIETIFFPKKVGLISWVIDRLRNL